MILSSVVPAAVQVNNNQEIGTKPNDLRQYNYQSAKDLMSIDPTLNIYPSKMNKIEIPEEPEGRMDLWDQVTPDGINGLSASAWSSYNREICDDFVADVPWIVSGGQFRVVTYYGYGPEAILGVNVGFYADLGGTPDTTPIAMYTATFNAWLTGDYYFNRPEIAIDCEFGPQVLTPGTYWVEFQPVSTDNCFWLTATGSGSCCYVSYPDLGYPKWTSALVVWGVAYNVAFKLTGSIAGIEHDVGVTSIISPSSGAAGPSFTPKIKVQNNGNQTEYNVPVNMTIGKWVPGSPATDYMNEQFNVWMPDGWSQEDYGEWLQSYSAYAGGTSPEAYLPYYNIYGDYAWLMSTAVDTTTASTLKLSFRSFIDDWGGGYYCTVETRANSVDSWTQRQPWTNPVYGNVGPALYEVDITDDIGTGTQVRFVFSGAAWNLDYWYVDNVKFFQPGTSGYYQTEYSQSLTVNIPTGAPIDVTFPDWAPAAWHNEENKNINYQINAWTALSGDEIPSNDLKTKDITLSYPFFHDIAVVSVDSPNTNGPAKPYPVKATIKNVGQYPERNFFIPMQIGEVLGSFIDEDFSGVTPPALPSGWNTNYPSNWITSNSNYAGGTAPELWFYWYPYTTATARCYTNPMDTTGYTNMNLKFKMYVSHYSGAYTLAVETSTDGVNWLTVWSMAGQNVPATDMTIPLTSAHGLGSSTFRVSFTFIGNFYNINWWAIDNIELKAPSIVEEYNEYQVITSWLNPGETKQFTYPDWTPAALEYGVSGTRNYMAIATHLCGTDTNPANDMVIAEFKLDYWHDVLVKEITQPSMGRGGEVIFHQRPYQPSESWSFYTTASAAGYLCQEDFWDLTASIGGVHWWGLTLIYSAGWYPGNPNGMKFEIKFYEPGTAPGAVVATYSNLEPVAVNTGLTYAGFPMYYWEVDLPDSVDLPDGWISIQSTYAPDNSWLLWAGSPEGNLNALQNGASLYDNLAFNLTAGGAGPVAIKVWKTPGTYPLESIVQNLGVFQETGLTCYANLYEYITDPNGTLIYSTSVDDINLDPLGGQQTTAFGTYNFDIQGAYGLFIQIPLSNDDAPNNNLKKIGIGIDATKPTSTHTLNPATPNGQNGWYVSDITVTLKADDGTEPWQSGVKEIKYKVAGGATQTITGSQGSFKITNDGNDIPVEYWAVDKVGNEETPHHTFTVDLDKTKPTVSLTYESSWHPVTGWTFEFTATATDATSGMERVEFYFNDVLQETVTGPGPTYQWTTRYYPLPHATVKATAYDIAGNSNSDTIENPKPHNNQQSTPNNNAQHTTVKINLGR
ncbi:MAG: hypothetical protein QHH15_03760 [Candidatus Thermoplasmatota archaeon]|nr:hypothetical protein [Candidatus Thermoplasmatota archaeon]